LGKINKIMSKEIICPNCNKEMYWNLDSFGYTPWHLHCDNCHINIGVNKQSKAIELLEKYHKPYTYIEYSSKYGLEIFK